MKHFIGPALLRAHFWHATLDGFELRKALFRQNNKCKITGKLIEKVQLRISEQTCSSGVTRPKLAFDMQHLLWDTLKSTPTGDFTNITRRSRPSQNGFDCKCNWHFTRSLDVKQAVYSSSLCWFHRLVLCESIFNSRLSLLVSILIACIEKVWRLFGKQFGDWNSNHSKWSCDSYSTLNLIISGCKYYVSTLP